MLEAVQSIDDDLIIASAGAVCIADFLVNSGRILVGRALRFQLFDQAFQRVRDTDGELPGLEQRFERLDGGGIASVAQCKD